MIKKWYIKPIAAFLTMALIVSNTAPAVARAEGETAVQDENLSAGDEKSLQEENQSEKPEVSEGNSTTGTDGTSAEPQNEGESSDTRSEDSGADKQNVPQGDAKENDAPVLIGNTGYQTLEEAVGAAASGDTIVLNKDVTVNACLNIGKNLTIASNGEDHTISRSDGYSDKLFQVSSGAVLTIGSGAESGRVILDGGAHWVKDVEVEDENAPGGKRTDTVDAESPAEDGAYNNGSRAAATLIWIQKGRLDLNKDGVLQNNDLDGHGGAVGTSAGGSSRINIRGTMQNNHVSQSGGAISSNGYIDVYDTAVLKGNSAGNLGGAVNNYGGGIMTVHDGSFSGNRALKGGAVCTDGKLEIKGGTMTGNTAEQGGAVCVESSNDSRSALIYNGTIQDNRAGTGADICQNTANAKYKGSVTIGEVYLPSGISLRVYGALSGSIGVIYADDPGDDGVAVARGDNYTMKESDAACIHSASDLYAVSYREQAAYLNYSPVIIDEQPSSQDRVEINETAEFSVTAHSAAGTEVSYQWYECSDSDGNDSRKLEGEVSRTLRVTKEKVGVYYYYCVVSADRAAQTRSEIVPVKFIDSSSADLPMITAQPEDMSIDLQKEGTLSIEAAVEDNGTLSYQWYRLSDPSQEEGDIIEGADEADYTVTADESGTFYYYCVVTNTNNNVVNKTSSVRSRTVQVQVSEAAVTYNGTAYSALDDALARIDGEKDGTLIISKDVTMSRTVTLTGGNLTVKAAEGTSPVIKMTSTFTGEAFVVKSGSLTMEQIVLDGGAIWSGTVHNVLKRGTHNQGRSVNKPMITMTGGTVNLEEGTIFQNNVAQWTSAGVVMSGGTLNINGAQMNDCYGGSHGGVIYANSSDCSINMTAGKMLRNQARSSTGAICADLGTKLSISGGEIADNYTVGRAGAVFINGTLHISGDTSIHNNHAGGNGGGILHLTGTFTMDGGSIRDNTANSNGGGIASLGGTMTLSQGTVSGNTASVNGNGIYLESGVNVTDDHVPVEVTDSIYSMKTLRLILDGNGSGGQSEHTVRYLDQYDLPEIERNGYQFLGWFTQPQDGDQVRTGDRIRTRSNQTLYAHWLLTATNAITIAGQPQGGTYYIEDNPKLIVDASAANGELDYQWYQCPDESGAGAQAVGENSKEFSLPADESAIGTYYYYCVVSAAQKDAEDVRTDVVKVELISRNHASEPEFTMEPEDAEIFVGDSVDLSSEAAVNDNGTITYQWYEGTSEDPSKAEKITGADKSVYTVTPSEAGIRYYFVKAVNTKTDEAGSEVTAESFSRGARILSHRKISVEQVSSSDQVLSQNYWNLYRIGTSWNEDGYITNATSAYGNYTGNPLTNAFDGKLNTFWETGRGGVVNQVEMNFSREVKIDRIVYGTRQDWLAGRGYPTKMTIYSKNGGGDWQEAGVAVSEENKGIVMFRLPETVTATSLRLDFTESTYGNWASAAEIILLRDESTVLTGNALIQGNAVPGEKLSVRALISNGPGKGDFTGSLDPVLNCQWQTSEDGVSYEDIEGATGSVYTVQENDRDQYLRAVIRDGTGQYSGSIISAPYRGSFQVNLEGNPAVGGKLSPKITFMTGQEVTYDYQWQSAGGDGTFEDIADATKESYTVTAEDAGKTIRAAVSVGGFTVYSDEVRIDVSAVLTGAPQTGSTLTASLSGVENADDLQLSYQWELSPDGTEESFATVDGATNDSYTIPEGMEGKYIRGVITVGKTGNVYKSDAWEILPAGTVQDCTKDYVYLSDLPKEKMLTGTVGFGNLEYDRNTGKNRISLMVDGQKNYFMKGFGAHANATLIFDVSDYVNYYHYDRFIAYLGVDSGQGSKGNGVTFQVQTSVDGEHFTTVKSTGVLKGTSDAVPVDIDLNGAKYLKIYIDINGNSEADHSVVADAKLARKTYEKEDQGTDLFRTVEEYDRLIKEYEEQHNGSHEELLKQDEYRKLLYQRTFVKAADYQMLKAYLYDESYVETLKWFLNDMEALDLYMGGGAPDGSYANFVETLKNLYLSNGTDMDDPEHGSLYKKMIITTALTHSGTVSYWVDSSVKSDAVRRYNIYKKLYDNGLLLNNVFERLSVEEMRWVMNNISADEEIEWLNYYVRYHTSKKNLAPEEFNLNNFTPGPYSLITYTKGYNYYLPKYYSADNKESWQKKYSLTNETADPKVGSYDFNITYESNHPRLWIVWEEGAVCGGISKTGSNLLTAFGVPGVVIGQPGHAAYFQYGETADGKGKWDIYNDISGWTLSEKGERMLNGWGNEKWKSAYNGSYLLLAQAALNEEDKYFTSQKLVKLADVYSDDPDRQIEIYEEALDVLDLNLDAWEGLINAYQNAGKGSKDYLQLADRISQALTYYPLPMRDILMNLIGSKLSSESDKAVVSIYVQSALNRAQSATANDTLQPKYCITMANYLLGKTDYQVATFSFDGDQAGKVVLNDNFSGGNELLISIDSGRKWINAGTTTEYQFSEEQLESITAEDDIRVQLQGTDAYYTIDITQADAPTKLYNNDRENRITGSIAGLEWKSEDGDGWSDLTADVTFKGDQTISVRKKRTGTKAASKPVSFSFTQDQDKATRKYIPLSEITLEDYSSAETAKNGAAEHILDGNIYTWWHTAWNGSDTKRYLTVKFSEPKYLTSIDYWPSGGNGTFQNVEVYTSMDQNSWVLSGTATGWATDTSTKTLNLYAPVYANYVMIKVTKGVNGFASGAMLEFYEDTTVEDKTVEHLELQTPPAKTTYVTGDELDPAGLNVKAYYTDGTYSSMNTDLLQFTPQVFRNTGTQTVQAAYRLDASVEPVTFDVTVEENTKTADNIEVVHIPDKTRYFVGDRLDLTGLQVKAHYTDGSSGYLFEDQYSVTPDILEQDGSEIPVTVSYLQGSQVLTAEFTVEVTKQVKEIRVTQKPEKDSYNLGDSLDTKGLEVSVVYSDDTTEILDSSEYTVETEGFSDTSGVKQVGVVYNRIQEIRTEFEVLVYPYITEGCLQFESDDYADTAYVSSVTDENLPADGKVKVPGQVTAADRLDFTVTKIASGAFAEKAGIHTVVLPKTVKRIDSGAFTGCGDLSEIYMTEYTDFEDFDVADDAFGPVDAEGAVQGTIYVADAELAEQLRNRNLTGLKNFLIVPVTDKMTEVKVTAPDKKDYHLGEELDLTGLSVHGTLENGAELELSSNLYEISEFDPARAGQQTMSVTVKGTGLGGSFSVNVTPAKPVIEQQPESRTYDMSEFPEPLQVKASTPDAGHLTYQWYVSENGEKFEKLTSDTGETCAVTPGETRYYYVEVTNNDTAGAPETATKTKSETVKITFGSYVARVGDEAFETLDDAVSVAQNGDENRIVLIRNILLDHKITISSDVTMEGWGIYRKTGYTGVLLQVDAGTLTMKNLTVDGGAVWSGAVDAVLNRGRNNSGTNEVTGQSAINPVNTMIAVTGGELKLSEGASLQNNCNTSNYGSNGGAVRVESGVLRIAGGQIINNYSKPYGGAVLSLGSSQIILEKGRVAGNQSPDSGGTFCVDGNSSFTMMDSGDENQPSVIENNKGNADGGVIWLKDGVADLRGGIIRNNRADRSGGVVHINVSGTVNLGNVQMEGNQAGSKGSGVNVNSGTINVTGVPSIEDTIYLPSGKLIQVKADLSGITRKIPVAVQNYQSAGAQFGTADSAALARAAAGAFRVTGGDLEVYAYNGGLYYGTPVTVKLTKDLPETATVMAGRQLTLSVEAAIEPEDAGELVYRWYRCSDAQGSGATLITVSESGAPNVLTLGDCSEGECYFYCEVSSSGGKADPVRSSICTVTVTRFVPAAKAIEKMNRL